MFRIVAIILLAALGFYGVWPAFSAYRIKTALEGENPALLQSKVDFDALRQSLKPAVTAEVEKTMAPAIESGSGGNAALAAKIKGEVVPAAVDGVLAMIVTPEGLIRIYRDRNDIKTAIQAIVAEKANIAGSLGALAGILGGGAGSGQGGKGLPVDLNALGGLFKKRDGGAGAEAKPATTTDGGGGSRYSLANVKSFSLAGPLGLSVGIAKDAAVSQPDATIDAAFTGGDWKLVGLRPRMQ